MPLLFPSFSPSFLVFLFFISVGWLVDSKFSARSSRGAKIQQLFFPSWRTPLPRERPVFLAKLFLSRLPATFLEEGGGGGGGGEDRGG